jgi:hypothetical protein
VLAVDHSLVLTNTTAMLEDLGHTALAALSGHTAIEIMRQKSADPALKHLFSARNPWIPLARERMEGLSRDRVRQQVGWAKGASTVPTLFMFVISKRVGTLRSAHPTLASTKYPIVLVSSSGSSASGRAYFHNQVLGTSMLLLSDEVIE